jgi:hypothetical protein
MGVALDKIIEYDTEVYVNHRDEVIIWSSWETVEGRWVSSIPSSIDELRKSHYDVVESHLRGLEQRIKNKHGREVRVRRKSLKLPDDWSSTRGPDWLVKKRHKKVYLDEDDLEDVG